MKKQRTSINKSINTSVPDDDDESFGIRNSSTLPDGRRLGSPDFGSVISSQTPVYNRKKSRLALGPKQTPVVITAPTGFETLSSVLIKCGYFLDVPRHHSSKKAYNWKDLL